MKILGFGERHLSEKLFREVKVDPEYYRPGHFPHLKKLNQIALCLKCILSHLSHFRPCFFGWVPPDKKSTLFDILGGEVRPSVHTFIFLTGSLNWRITFQNQIF